MRESGFDPSSDPTGHILLKTKENKILPKLCIPLLSIETLLFFFHLFNHYWFIICYQTLCHHQEDGDKYDLASLFGELKIQWMRLTQK